MDRKKIQYTLFNCGNKIVEMKLYFFSSIITSVKLIISHQLSSPCSLDPQGRMQGHHTTEDLATSRPHPSISVHLPHRWWQLAARPLVCLFVSLLNV